MLDIHTLKKVENWFTVRINQIEESAKNTAGLQQEILRHQIKIVDDLKTELIGKRRDIEQAIEAGGKLGHLIKEKDSKRGSIYRCPTCDAKRSLIRTYFSESHVQILRKLFQYCVENKTRHIKTRDITTLSHSDYCNIAQLQRFGFIYFPEGRENRKRNGEWGVAVGRIYDFLENEWPVAEYSERDTVTKEQHVSQTRVTLKEIRKGREKEGEHLENTPYFIRYLEWDAQHKAGLPQELIS